MDTRITYIAAGISIAEERVNGLRTTRLRDIVDVSSAPLAGGCTRSRRREELGIF